MTASHLSIPNLRTARRVRSAVHAAVGCAGWSVEMLEQRQYLASYVANFNTGAPPGSILYGSATVDATGGTTGGKLSLTRVGAGNRGSLILPDFDPSHSARAFSISFKMLIGGGSGADGIGFSFGTPPGEAFADFGYLTSHNLTVNFNTFGGDGDGPWIYAFATPGGGQINSNINPRTSPARYVPVIVTWQNDRLSVRYDGIDVFPGGVALSGWNALVGDKFGFGGRIGGLWDNHFIDDVSVSTVTTPDATGTPDLLAASDTGVSNTDNITKASSLTFSVPTAETGALVELLRDDVVVASRTGSGELTLSLIHI